MDYDHEDYEALMQEAPGGDNHGRAYVGSTFNTSSPPSGAPRELGRDANTAWDVFRGGGYGIIGPSEGGTFSHAPNGRQVLSAEEYVDQELLRSMALDELGFTAEQLDVYRIKGTATKVQRRLRERIDSRLLALSRSGGHMRELALAIGLPERTVERALARARANSSNERNG